MTGTFILAHLMPERFHPRGNVLVLAGCGAKEEGIRLMGTLFIPPPKQNEGALHSGIWLAQFEAKEPPLRISFALSAHLAHKVHCPDSYDRLAPQFLCGEERSDRSRPP